MKNTLTRNGLLVITAAVALAACSKNNVPKPTTKLSYQFKVTAAIAPVSATAHAGRLNSMALSTTPANVTWQSGYANVSSISFDGENEIDSNKNEEDNFTEPSVFKVDLFAGNTLLGNINMANGNYQNISIKLHLKQTATDSAFYLNGIYNSSIGNAIPVVLSLDGEHGDFEISVKAGNLVISTGQSYVEFLDLHFDTLMAGVTAADLDAATLTNGKIIINATSNMVIYDKISANIDNFCDGEGGS